LKYFWDFLGFGDFFPKTFIFYHLEVSMNYFQNLNYNVASLAGFQRQLRWDNHL
jgi:hypothetical protein